MEGIPPNANPEATWPERYNPGDPQYYAMGLISASNTMLADYISDANLKEYPNLYAGVFVGAHLNLSLRELGMSVPSDEPYTRAQYRNLYDTVRENTAQAVIGSTEWPKIIQNVKSGKASWHEVYLVVKQAGDRDEQIQRQRRGRKLVGDKFDLVNVINKPAEAARAALYRYCFKNSRSRFFHTETLQATALATIIERQGLLENLSLERPNWQLIGLGKAFSDYAANAVNMDTYNAGANSNDYKRVSRILDLRNGIDDYIEDIRSYSRGHVVLAKSRGRSWHFLGENGRRQYNTYLSQRAGGKTEEQRAEYLNQANGYLNFALDQPASMIKSMLSDVLDKLDASDLESDHDQACREQLGILWAAVTLKCRFEPIEDIVEEFSGRVKYHEEVYVLDGLPLVARGLAPAWLMQLVDQSYVGKGDLLSVFTEESGPVSGDVAKAKAALEKRTAELSNYNSRTKEVIRIISTYEVARQSGHGYTLMQLGEAWQDAIGAKVRRLNHYIPKKIINYSRHHGIETGF